MFHSNSWVNSMGYLGSVGMELLGVNEQREICRIWEPDLDEFHPWVIHG